MEESKQNKRTLSPAEIEFIDALKSNNEKLLKACYRRLSPTLQIMYKMLIKKGVKMQQEKKRQ